MPTVSLILPMYQVEAYIRGCISSIKAQTYTDFECICVDDGSPDKSVEKAREAIGGDTRFRIIHQENKMLGGARNTGIAAAQGDYITILDSDDYIHPCMLEILVKTMREYDVDIAGCLLQRTPDLYHPIAEDPPAYKVKIYEDVFHTYLSTKTIATSVCARLYKRELIKDIPFLEKTFFEDTPWTPRAFMHCKRYAAVDAPLYYYFKNSDSIMNTGWSEKKTEDFLKTLDLIHAMVKEERSHLLDEVCVKLIAPTAKMIFNRIRKSPSEQRTALWTHAASRFKDMHERGVIGYKGLKLKHKIRLFCLLRHV